MNSAKRRYTITSTMRVNKTGAHIVGSSNTAKYSHGKAASLYSRVASGQSVRCTRIVDLLARVRRLLQILIRKTNSTELRLAEMIC